MFTIVASSLSPSRSPLTCAPRRTGVPWKRRRRADACCDITSGPRAVPRRSSPNPAEKTSPPLPESPSSSWSSSSTYVIPTRVRAFSRTFSARPFERVFRVMCVCVRVRALSARVRARGEENFYACIVAEVDLTDCYGSLSCRRRCLSLEVSQSVDNRPVNGCSCSRRSRFRPRFGIVRSRHSAEYDARARRAEIYAP